jgi:hypothetical protein
MVMEPTQALTHGHQESSWGPAREADNLTAFCEPIVYIIWQPQQPVAGMDFAVVQNNPLTL